MTKLPEELHHILGEVAHPSPAFCGFGELGSYVVGLIYSLACTERAFDLIPLSHGLGRQGLPLRTGRFLGRSSEWFAIVPDFQVFEYGSVGLVHIDLVCKDGGRQTTEALPVFVDLELEVSALVVGIPAVVVDEVIALHDADTDFGTELHIRGRLSPDNGAYMGLEDAHDPVLAAMLARAEHLLLLEVHLHRGIQNPALVFAQAVKAIAELPCSEVCQRKNVPVQATEHLPDGVLHQLAALLLHLHQVSVGVPRLTIICIGNGDAGMLADTADEAVHDTASVINNIHINGVAYLGICTCRIYFQHTFVRASLAVCEGCCILFHDGSGRRLLTTVPGFVLLVLPHLFLHLLLTLQKNLGHLVDVIVADALAQVHKKGGVKYRLVSELPKSAEILHVGILLDHPDGVLVGQTGDVLDYHGTYHHAGWLGTGSRRLVVECLTVLLFVLVPRKMVAQPNPTVALVQTLKGRPETVNGQLLVSWLKSHLLVSFNTQRYSFFVKQKNKYCYIYLNINKLIINQ